MLASTLLWNSAPSAPLTAGPSPKVEAPPASPARRQVPSTKAPAAAWSHYLTRTSSSLIRGLGCDEGRHVRGNPRLADAIVVLAFGRPVRHGHVYGTSLFGRGFVSTDGVIRAAQAYAEGFTECVRPMASFRLTLALGTSNYGSQVSFHHGRAWARMVNETNEWLQANGYWGIRAAGANDIELAWNSPRVTRRWVDGYDSEARWPYYDFGDAGACPPAGRCAGAWTLEDVWFVSWGARSAWPLPQVYNERGTQAEQWYRLSLYAHQRHGQRMTIAGAVSQRQACRESSDSCRGINNTSKTAWRQLWLSLNQDPRTAQPLRWVTDFQWDR